MKVLKDKSRMRELDCSGREMRDDDVFKLIGNISQYKDLRVLNLSENRIQDDGACALAEMLTKNSTIVELNLSGNMIGDKGRIAIAKALEKNNSVSILEMTCDSIREDTYLAFAQTLKTNTTLRNLYLLSSIEVLHGLGGGYDILIYQINPLLLRNDKIHQLRTGEYPDLSSLEDLLASVDKERVNQNVQHAIDAQKVPASDLSYFQPRSLQYLAQRSIQCSAKNSGYFSIPQSMKRVYLSANEQVKLEINQFDFKRRPSHD